MRYLLKCDAVDCCTEEQAGNHIEYQIPNVHPNILAPVSHPGNETITLFNGSTIVADVWKWKFAVEKYTVHTVGEELLRWNVNVGDNYTNEYVNYTAVQEADLAAFSATFAVPPQCKGTQIPKCAGVVSEKSLKFLRAGSMPVRPL